MRRIPTTLLIGCGSVSGLFFESLLAPACAAELGAPAVDLSFVSTILAGALVFTIGALFAAGASRRRLLRAQEKLAALAAAETPAAWVPTGVDGIDRVARTIVDLDRRIAEKRQRIAAGQDEIRAAEAHGRAMDRELHHRVNNTLAMIQGVANITARAAPDFDSFRAAFSERLHCLGRISTLVVSRSWASTPMRQLAQTALDCGDEHMRARIDLSGDDDVALGSDVALALGMALHELYSNAVRHGALSNDAGRVRLAWRATREDEPHIALTWVESGGPPPDDAAGSGVGFYLVRHVLARQFEGEARISMEPQGLRAEISASRLQPEVGSHEALAPIGAQQAPAASPGAR